MNTEGYTCYVPRMGTDYRITPYSYITSFVCCHPEGSESEATRKISEISVLQKISFACFSVGHEFRPFASIPFNEFALVDRLNRLNR